VDAGSTKHEGERRSYILCQRQHKTIARGVLRQSAVAGPTYDGSFVVTLSRQATESKGSQKVWDREPRTLRYASKTTKGYQLGPKW
jgi:hypothetical protein